MENTVAEAMKRRMDRAVEKALYGSFFNGRPTMTSSTAWADQEPLTVAKLEAMIDALPPKETWVVSSMFAPNVALLCKTPGENLTCLNESTWLHLRSELRRLTPIEHRDNPLYEIRPVFIDEHPAERKRILGRMTGVMTAHVELKRVLEAWWRRPIPS